jgi:aryl-alcohol dehydrogenase-like predicted oxidoreductase
MNFSSATQDEAIATIHTALDSGINFIDTANVYSAGESETVVGQALQGKRDGVVLATKVHGQMGSDRVNGHGNGRRHIKAQCEASLRRLGTDRIDLYQLHRPDPATPIEETLEALDDLVRQGKVHYVGVSTYPAWRTMEALSVAQRSHLSSMPATEQPPYNLLDRRVESEVIPLCQEYGLGVLPWSPLAFGILTGKYSAGVPEDTRLSSRPAMADRPDFPAAIARTAELQKVAEQAGLSLVELSLAWLMQQPGVTAPIIGPRNREQLADNLAAADVRLDAATLAEVDRIVPPQTAVFAL